MINIGFLVSGNGGTLKFLHLVQQMNLLEFEIKFVIADRDCGAVGYAHSKGIANHIVQYDKSNRSDLIEILRKYNNVDLIITNIHKILDKNILEEYNGRLINLHYSLLPAYGGLIGMKTVKQARQDNSMFIGATCHEVSEILDGGKILCQSCFAVDWNMTDEKIMDLVFQSANLCLLNSILIKKVGCTFNNDLSVNKGVSFNPILNYSLEKFTEDFWNSLNI